MDDRILANAPYIMRKSAFARLLGITPGAVQAAERTGNISLTRDKMVNTRNPKNIRYANECRARKEKTAKGQSEEAKKPQTKKPGPVARVPKLPESANGEDSPESEADQFKADYSIAKLIAQTTGLQIRNAATLKLLIDRKFVDAVIGRIASVLSNHMLTMGDRVSAECAAVCGALTPENKIAVKQIIDKDTTRSINALKMEIQKQYESKVEA